MTAWCAKDHREAMFLTQMHPLVLEAAAWESRELPCRVCVSISTGDLPAGDYGFLIYAWRYTGLKQDIRLAAVSENPVVEKKHPAVSADLLRIWVPGWGP